MGNMKTSDLGLGSRGTMNELVFVARSVSLILLQTYS